MPSYHMPSYTQLFFLLCFISNIILGQKSQLVFVDSVSKVRLQFVTVQNEQNKLFSVSDENGNVSIADIEKNNFIRIQRMGYESKTIAASSLRLKDKQSTIYLIKSNSNLDELVISSSSRYGVFQPISQLDIHIRPINTSQDVLRIVPGLFIGQHAGGGKAEQIFLRGFDLDHGTDINISVDGMPVNMVSHAHGQGYADLHFVIPELIQTVNFNKGLYFEDKGNFTTAGFVEFKTQDYLEKNFAKIEVGQFNTWRTVAGVNLLAAKRQKRTQSLYFAGEGFYSKGYFDAPQNFDRFNGILKYNAQLNPNTYLKASLTGFKSKWNASGQIPNRAVLDGTINFYGAIDDNEGGATSRYNANVELVNHLNDGSVLRNQLFYSNYNFELYSNFTFYKEDSINGDQIRQKENRHIIGSNDSYEKEFFIGNFKTTTKAGFQMRYDQVDNIELTRTKDRKINLQEMQFGNLNEMNVGTYYSQQIAFNDKFSLTAAMRLDYFHNHYDNQLAQNALSSESFIFSPKLNFNYRLNKAVQFYLYNGKGFHSNDTRVAVQQNGKKVLPPAYGSDLGGIFRIGKKIVVQTAIWYLWLDQEFVYVGDEGVVEPGGQTQRFGFDLSARGEIVKNLYADIDVSLAKPSALNVPTTANYLPLAPRFTSVAGLTYKQPSGLNASLRYRYMADRPANETNTVVAEGYFIVDATLSYASKKWETGISVQNLLNTKWKETQFDTESKLKNEPAPVSEIHFTPGSPFFLRWNVSLFF